MTKFHEFPHMFATRGKPRVEIPYENRKKMLPRLFSVLHKTHENREKMRPAENRGSRFRTKTVKKTL